MSASDQLPRGGRTFVWVGDDPLTNVELYSSDEYDTGEEVPRDLAADVWDDVNIRAKIAVVDGDGDLVENAGADLALTGPPRDRIEEILDDRETDS